MGILQALAVTGQVSYGAAVPIIMGQNIGTCVTAMISAVGANKGARRTAFVHLYFNVIGSLVFLAVYMGLDSVLQFGFAGGSQSTAFLIFSQRWCFCHLPGGWRSWLT